MFLAFAINGSYAQNNEIVIPYPENASVALAMGWDVARGVSTPNICIKNYQEFTTSVDALTQGFTQGNNSFSLQQSLNVSYKERVRASESAAFVARETTSASESASVSLASNFDMASDNRYIVATQTLIKSWDSLQSTSAGVIQLTDAAAAMSDQEFAENCGTGYVVRIEKGAEFQALFNMHQTGFTSTTQVAARLQQNSSGKASFLGQSVSGAESTSGSSSASNGVSDSNFQMTIHLNQSGADLSGVSAGTDADSVLDEYASFASRVTEESAKNVLLAVMPYPNPSNAVTAPLAGLESPYVVLGREYAKWSYLENTLNKIISSSTQGAANAYVSIDGVTLSATDLNHMEDMAQAKVLAVQAVIDTCMTLIESATVITQADMNSDCSLTGKKVSFTTTDIKPDSRTYGQEVTSQVDVAESDIYYLVRLPFSKDVYDGQIASGTAGSNNLSYQDIVSNQVNGIYAERCGSGINQSNYCETAASVSNEVAKYYSQDVGQMYYQYQVKGGSGVALCLSFKSAAIGTISTSEDCATAASFGFDEVTKQVKVRLYSQPNKIFCVSAGTRLSNYSNYGHYPELAECQQDVGHSQSSAMAFWEPVVVPTSTGASDEVKVVMLRDTNYDERSESDSHTNCLTSHTSDTVGQNIWQQECSSFNSPSAEQTWQQVLGQFYLEAVSSE